MEPAFTLGILYGCGCGFRTAQYFEQLAAYYLKSMSRVRVLIALTGKCERSVAAVFGTTSEGTPGWRSPSC